MLGWGKLPGLGKDSLLDKALRQLVKIIKFVCSSGIKLSFPVAPLPSFLLGTSGSVLDLPGLCSEVRAQMVDQMQKASECIHKEQREV